MGRAAPATPRPPARFGKTGKFMFDAGQTIGLQRLRSQELNAVCDSAENSMGRYYDDLTPADVLSDPGPATLSIRLAFAGAGMALAAYAAFRFGYCARPPSALASDAHREPVAPPKGSDFGRDPEARRRFLEGGAP
jgi:hypothetical protein